MLRSPQSPQCLDQCRAFDASSASTHSNFFPIVDSDLVMRTCVSNGFTLFCRTATTTQHPSACLGNRLPIACRFSGPLPTGLVTAMVRWLVSSLPYPVHSRQKAVTRFIFGIVVSTKSPMRSSASSTSGQSKRERGGTALIPHLLFSVCIVSHLHVINKYHEN